MKCKICGTKLFDKYSLTTGYCVFCANTNNDARNAWIEHGLWPMYCMQKEKCLVYNERK